MLAVGLLAALLTVGVLLFDFDATRSSREFVESDRFLVRATFLAAQSALWVALALWLRDPLRSLRADHPIASDQKRKIAGSVAIIVAVIGMWLVEAASARLARLAGEEALREYLRLRDDLRRFLNTAAVVIAAATLSTGALRGAVLANVKVSVFHRSTSSTTAPISQRCSPSRTHPPI